MDKISIIVAAYNVEHYIDKCINSLLNQSYLNIEIIIINDASTDETENIILNHMAKDKRIIYLKNDYNKGLSTSRNIGIQRSSGNYIMFCDADDYYSPNMCKVMHSELLHSHSDIVVCNTNTFYDDNIKVTKKIKNSNKKYFTNKAIGTYEIGNRTLDLLTNAVVWNKIFKKDIIILNNITFPDGLLFESYPFFIAYLACSKRITFIGDKLYNYRRRSNSIMSKTFKKSENAVDYIRSCNFLLLWLLKNDHFERFKTIFINNFIFSVTSSLRYSPNNLNNKIYDIAEDIIKKANINPNTLGQYTKLAVTQILNRDLYYEKSLNVFDRNLVLMVKNLSTLKYYLFGITIFKYDFLKVKSFITKLLTFPKLIRKIKVREKKKFCFIKLNCVNDDKLVKALRDLKTVVFLPNPGNLGDCLIARATYDFFEKNKINYKIYKPGLKSKTLVFGGGGLFVENLYKHAYDNIITIFEQFDHIVMLPCTIYDCIDFEKIISNKFTIFCRDKQTYYYLKSLKSGAEIIQDYDMAFRLSENIFSQSIIIDSKRKILLNKLFPILSRIGTTARFIRTDSESSTEIKTHLDLSLTFGSRVMSTSDTNFATALMIAIVSKYDTIVTDRLHIAIAGILLGKHLYIINNNNNKVYGVIDTISSNIVPKHTTFQGVECIEIKPNAPVSNAFRQLCSFES